MPSLRELRTVLAMTPSPGAVRALPCGVRHLRRPWVPEAFLASGLALPRRLDDACTSRRQHMRHQSESGSLQGTAALGSAVARSAAAFKPAPTHCSWKAGSPNSFESIVSQVVTARPGDHSVASGGEEVHQAGQASNLGMRMVMVRLQATSSPCKRDSRRLVSSLEAKWQTTLGQEVASLAAKAGEVMTGAANRCSHRRRHQ